MIGLILLTVAFFGAVAGASLTCLYYMHWFKAQNAALLQELEDLVEGMHQ